VADLRQLRILSLIPTLEVKPPKKMQAGCPFYISRSSTQPFELLASCPIYTPAAFVAFAIFEQGGGNRLHPTITSFHV
jgi:hypothetical protein